MTSHNPLEGADLPPILTANQLGAIFNVTGSTARRWLRRGYMPGFRIGTRWYTSRAAFNEHMQNGGAPPDRAP